MRLVCEETFFFWNGGRIGWAVKWTEYFWRRRMVSEKVEAIITIYYFSLNRIDHNIIIKNRAVTGPLRTLYLMYCTDWISKVQSSILSHSVVCKCTVLNTSFEEVSSLISIVIIKLWKYWYINSMDSILNACCQVWSCLWYIIDI